MTDPTAELRAELAEALVAAEAAEADARTDAARARARAAELLRGPEAPREWRRRARAGAVGLLAGALLALTALMLVQHQRAAAQRDLDSEFIEAARTGVIALLSIDHSHARADVQHVLDLSTGSFRDDFQRRADDFVATAEKSNAVTKGSVSAAALEWAQADDAVVLVAASSQVTNATGARDDPRPWRMSVTVTREAQGVKMSGVEFVP